MPSQPRTIYLLKTAEIELRNLADAWLRAEEVTLAQYTVLSLIAGGRHTSAELARRLGMRPQSINEVVQRFEARGLISRQEVVGNRRERQITLTDEGSRLLARCDGSIDQVEAQLLGGLDSDQRKGLREALSAIVAVARRSAPPDQMAP